MTSYVNYDDFLKIFPNTSIPQNEIMLYLEAASSDVDSMTFNRITACGFDNLTDFQKEKVRSAVCRQAAFRYENAELFESAIQSYSINGVSVTYDKSRIMNIGGVMTAPVIFAEIKQSGLCCRRL